MAQVMAADVQRLDNLRAQLAALPPGEARAAVEVELGELLLERGDYGQALVHLGAARHERSDGKLRQRVELGTGLALLRRGETERAEPCLERLLAAARARRDREAEAQALLHLGEIYRRRGEAARATAALERARLWLEAHPRSQPLATLYTNLAELALAAGDVDGAMQLAGDAVELASAIFATVEEIAALISVGRLLERREDWPGAEAAVARAMELAATGELPRELAEAQLAYAHVVGVAGAKLDDSRVGAAAAWVARAQALFKEHGALGDLERARAAFRVFGRRATDRAPAPAVTELADEMQRARRELAMAAHQLVDALAQGIDRVDDTLPPAARARLHAVVAAAVAQERGLTAGVAQLADAEGRVLAALQSSVVAREDMGTLLDQIRALNGIADPDRLLREACKAAAQLTGADRCVVALLDGDELTARASLRVADVARDRAWRQGVQAVLAGAGPLLLAHEPARVGDRGGGDRGDRGDRNGDRAAERAADHDNARRRDGDARLGKALATPLRHGETLFGAIYVDKELCGGLFGLHELELLSNLSAQLATMLANARAGGAVRAGLQARSVMLDGLSDGVLAVDERGLIAAANAVATRLFGLDARTRLGDLPPLAFARSILERGQAPEPRPLRLGGGDYLCRARPLGDGEGRGVLITLTALDGVRALSDRLAHPPCRSFADVIGRAPSLRRRVQLAEAAARHEGPVYLSGEPGTGKRLFAESIHRASPRREGPFFMVSCTATARDRLALELLGTRDGAPGKLALAAGGTLLLDEIGELPLDLQRELVQILDGKGPARGVELARVIATSSRDLERDAEERRFRRDLWARLSAVHIALPPLRARPGDVQILITHLLSLTAARLGKRVRSVSPALAEALAGHGWPGNVRELEQLLEVEVARAGDGQTRLERVPEALRPRPVSSSRPLRPGAVGAGKGTRTLAETERELLLRALAEHAGAIPEVARQLGVSRGTVYNMMRRHAVDAERFRS
jgi:transcriptional regulator with PAS, ATPase and Fis domain/tetratricopeptide (TPR) repeat protein